MGEHYLEVSFVHRDFELEKVECQRKATLRQKTRIHAITR